MFLTLIALTQLAGTAVGAQSAPLRFLLATADSTTPSVEIDPSVWPAFRKRISITLDGVPRREALRRLAALSGLRFVYANDLIGAEDTVRLEANNMPVSVALTEVLRGASVDVAVSRDGSAVLIRRALPPTRLAYGVIDGLVTDDDLGRIAMADISILSSPVRMTTSEGGRFRITDMAPGPYAVVVRKIGFQPLAAIVHVAAGDTARLTFSLQRLAVGLDTVRITERSRSWKIEGFERRRKAGIGYYASVDDITRWGGWDLGNFLRRFPTIAIRPNEKTGEMSIESVRARGFLQSNCAMKVIVDDVPMPSGIGLSTLPRMDEISGIEVYTGAATVPAQFVMGGVGCGAIVFWTKSGF